MKRVFLFTKYEKIINKISCEQVWACLIGKQTKVEQVIQFINYLWVQIQLEFEIELYE